MDQTLWTLFCGLESVKTEVSENTEEQFSQLNSSISDCNDTLKLLLTTLQTQVDNEIRRHEALYPTINTGYQYFRQRVGGFYNNLRVYIRDNIYIDDATAGANAAEILKLSNVDDASVANVAGDTRLLVNMKQLNDIVFTSKDVFDKNNFTFTVPTISNISVDLTT